MSAAAVVRGPAQARWVAALRDVIAAAGPSRGGVAGIWADPGSALVVAVLAAAQAGLTPRVLTDQEYAVTGLEVLLADGSWPGWFDEAAAPASPVIEIDGTAVIDALTSPAAGDAPAPMAPSHPLALPAPRDPSPATDAFEAQRTASSPAASGVLSHPASAAQRQMWLLDQFDDAGALYAIGMAWLVEGEVDPQAMAAAFVDLQVRHPALRTHLTQTHHTAPGEHPIRQVVNPTPQAELELVEVAGDDELAAQRHSLAEVPMRVDRPPLIRGRLVRSASGRCEVHLVIHHAICDEWSIELIGRDLAACYQRHVTGAPDALPPIQTTPGVHAERNDRPDRRAEVAAALDRAAALLADAAPALDLPTDRQRDPDGPAPLGEHRITLGEAAWAALTRLRGQGFSHFQTLTTAYGLTLAHAAGQEDIVLGTVVTERGAPELAEVVGMFVNTVPVRLRLPAPMPLREALSGAQEAILDALDTVDAPFDELVARVRPDRADEHPIFQHAFILAPAIRTEAAAEVAFRPLAVPTSGARFDLTLYAIEYPDGLVIRLDYDATLFEPATISRLAGAIEATIAALATDPDLAIADLPWLAPADAQALTGGRVQHRREASGPSVDGLILAQCRATPDAIAVEDLDAAGAGISTWTYAELARDATRVAHALRTAGIGPGDVVAATSPGGLGVVGFLAIIGIGATWLPLDAGQPVARLHSLLTRSGARALLRADALLDIPDEVAVLDVDALLSAADPTADGLAEDPFEGAGAWPPQHPAYLIFTSGSTGEPKGVLVPHAGLRNLALGFVEVHDFTGADAILALPPLFFDAALGDVVPALIMGARLVLHADPAVLTGPGVLDLVRSHAITSVDTASSLWQRWVEDVRIGEPVEVPPQLTRVMVGGEAVPLRAVRAWAALGADQVRLVNHYGPTEASVCATVQDCGLPIAATNPELLSPGTDLAIGTALPEVRAYVLDAAGRPLAPGIRGEICLGGPGVALGYLGDPRATAAAFVPDPYADHPGARMYRTGDLGRLDHQGRVHFVGRRDGQVKIRGRRIEIGEVEAALAGITGVSGVAVTAPVGTDGNRRLIAYLVPDPDLAGHLDLDAVRETMRRRLPAYLIPDAVVPLAALPLTPQGKVDTRALPEPDPHRTRPPHLPPATATEVAIAQVWAQALGVDQVGLRDRFTDLGGHSLAAAGAVSRINLLLGSSVQLRDLLGSLDLEQVAARADASATAPVRAPDTEILDRLRRDADPALTPAMPRASHPPRRILLTGATGLLGGHLIDALLTRGDAEVVALVRAPDPGAGRERLARALEGLGLAGGHSPRLSVVTGELDRPGLGLARHTWQELAESIDAVVHSGGLVNFVEGYDALRAPNVGGTLEALRLAGAHRAAALHFVGTLGIFLTPRYAGLTVTEATEPEDPAGLHDGYNQSKWVADRAVRTLASRGLPVAIHRPARITGATGTGRGNADDWFSAMLTACAELGLVPDLPGREDMTPVDVVAGALAADVLAGPEPTEPLVAHYFNPVTVTYPQLAAALAAQGFAVELVPYAQWWDALRTAIGAGGCSAFAPYAALLRHPDAPPPAARAHFDSTATFARAAAAGIHCPPADQLLVEAQVRFLAGLGRLPESRHG